ncbi:RNA polymerase II transcription factor B subunit 4 [Maublancomyces gigas]|uniref:General transcription and DNA repair factor IIH subunit TFB4 n=1 Tax=Discina gigas TaxID=1032678 RepID=A0ABR3GBN2_9PEZI
MDGFDASAHYTQAPEDDKPSLLVLILDTNPFAWSKLHPTLPLPRAVASILLFLNAHLAFSHANRVAVIAAHTKEAVFLYPSTHPSTNSETSVTDDSTQSSNNDPLRDANKYRQFRIVEDEVQASFRRLMASTTPDMLAGTNETMMAGALSLALAYINRLSLASEDPASGGATGGNRTANGTRDADVTSMNARILVLSVSGDLSTQYVSMMNSIFAAQRKKIPIDICKIAGETVFLQQASDATRGIYMQLQHPGSLLQYLMVCFLSFEMF